jgi:hypothetical protein
MIMYSMYTAHHLVTIFAYCFALSTHMLGGVMVQGLCFEVPVVLMLRREIAVALEDPPIWLRRTDAVHMHWTLTYLAFFLGRGLAECLWIVSMVPGYGPPRLQRHTNTVGFVVYHTLGVFFTSLNLRIIGLFWTWHAQDLASARSYATKGSSEAAETELGRPPDAVLAPMPESIGVATDRDASSTGHTSHGAEATE